MYEIVLFIHSWLRWLVLAAALVVLVRSIRGLVRRTPWEVNDTRASRAFVGLVDVQLLLGLLLYVALSPIVRIAISDLGAAMTSPALRFFTIEHATAMLPAVIATHIGSVRARKAKDDRRRHRIMLVTVIVFAVLVLIGMPWPPLKYGRPLVRTSLPSSGEASLYDSRCAACHGANGHGDGPAAGTMDPPPRDFADAAWQRSVSDEHVREVVTEGGAQHGLSPNMPAFPDLTDGELDELVQFVRARR